MRRPVSLVALAALFLPLPALAGVVLSQPADLAGSWASQNDPSFWGAFASAYDDFILPQNTSIYSVSWVGSYIGEPAPGAMQSFTLTFWSGVSGPGAAIASYAVAGDAGETFVGLGSDGNAYYAYSSGLATPFEAWAGTTYWLSVVANMDYLDPLGNSREWGWAFATGGDGHWYQDFFGTRYHDGDSVGDPSTDLAFTLSTPEPGAYSLILAGLSALAALRRRAGRRRY